MKRLFYIFSLFLLLIACEQSDINFELDQANDVVVYGYIEDGQNPIVFLTYSANFTGKFDSSSLSKQLIADAIVNVYSSADSEQLSFKRGDEFIPPFYYEANQLKGKVGESYRLKIEIDGRVIEAVTTIPEKEEIDSMWFVANASNSDGQIWISMQDNNIGDDFYRILTRKKGSEGAFYPTLNYGAFSDHLFEGKSVDLSLLRGLENYVAPFGGVYFEIGDTIEVKLNTMDRISYDIWKQVQNEIFNYGNPLSAPNNPVGTNIIGGIGAWTGYGSNNYTINIRQ